MFKMSYMRKKSLFCKIQVTSRMCWLLRSEFLPITPTVPPEPPPVILAPYKVPSSPLEALPCCISCTNCTSLSVPSEPSPQAL